MLSESLASEVISNEDENIAEVPGALIACPNVADFNKVSLEARGIKIKITKVDIPVAFASARAARSFVVKICVWNLTVPVWTA